MDWFKVATNDWEIYRDTTRIHKYVEFGKITEEQYNQIVATQ